MFVHTIYYKVICASIYVFLVTRNDNIQKRSSQTCIDYAGSILSFFVSS